MTTDVEWPDNWAGGLLEGREAVRDHWVRQLARFRVTLTPLRFHEVHDGRIEVTVRQVTRDPSGLVLAREDVRHVYEFEGRLVRRLHLERLPIGAPGPA